MQNLCGNSKEEIVKMLKALRDICNSNTCADCPFGHEDGGCLFNNWSPSDFRINDESSVWRAAH